MSTTIDNKVVEMRFDNRNFEQNVKTSMSTLDKLKKSLNLTGAAKGLDSIQSAANKVNFSGMSKGIDAVTTRFSYFQATVQHQLNNIVDSAVNAGKRIVSALTIDPVKTGFQEYETQINAVQTILANTKSKGSTLTDVNKALDELNTYADKTIYNFTEMTRNIGTFTAAGVDLDTSVSSIKGIANLAAVSGSTSQQASTAMYQLSQALAAGKVSLMDWNSVVNAGMGGQIFQDALVRTSEVLGTGAEEAIKKYGSFRESLTKGEWLTTEVLTETLTQLSGAYTEADLIAQGFSKSQAEAITDLADTAVGAATEVKTFTQLWDTLKEAAQSGWTQTWEILIGDFEEAKSLLTNISNVVGDFIGKTADARNNVLQGWKDAGGRDDLLASFKNTFEAILSLVSPIKEAFYEIFPKKSLKEKIKYLTDFTKNLKEFTSGLKISGDTAKKIKASFKGVFSILDIGVSAIKSIGKGVFSLSKNFTGFGGGLLEAASGIGDFLTKLRDGIKENDIFDNTVNKIVNTLSNGIIKIKEFGTALKNSFELPEANSFLNFFKGLWNTISSIGSVVFETIGSIFSAISETFGKGDIFEVINSGLFGALLLSLRDYVKGLTDPFESTQGFFSKIKDVLDGVRSSLEEWQNNLKSGTLLKIAAAIGILAAALFVVSTIDADSLSRSLVGIGILFAELMGSLFVFTKIDPDLKGVTKAILLFIGVSTAVGILSVAMKNISSNSWGDIAKGLITIGLLFAELSIFLNKAKFDKKMTKSALGIVLLSTSLLILAQAVKNFGSMNWSEIGKGLIAIGGLLAEISLFAKLTGNAKHVMSTGISMIALAAAMKILASAMKDFGGMEWGQIGKGLAVMGGALAELVVALRLMPKGNLFNATGLIVAAAALKILYSALSDFGGMSWNQIGLGLVAMGGALAELAIGLKLMRGTLSGSASLLVASAALAIFVPVMKSLGDLSWTEIGKGLVTLAGAFAVIGVAGLLLAPIVPAIIGLSAAILLLGVGVSGIGVGLTLIAAGIAALSGSIAAGSTVIVASLQAIILGILNLIPAIAQVIGRTIVEIAVILGDAAPKLAESFCKLIIGVADALAVYAPQLIDSLLTLLIDVINGLANHTPELIKAFVNLLAKVFEGVVEVLNNADTDNLLKGITAVGLMAVIARLLAGIIPLIPSAMAGLVGVGVLIAELALVLAAIGGLAQIPGLSWLIDEGGDLLAKIGSALGKAIGSLIGGIGEGLSGTLPQIGKNIADFMEQLSIASKNASGVDSSSFDGVTKLMSVMTDIGFTTVGTTISDIFTLGGTSMEKFQTDGVAFFNAMRAISNSAAGITMDEQSIDTVISIATKLSELQSTLEPIGGVISWFTGRDDLGTFGINVGIFLLSMKTAFSSLNGVTFNQEALNAIVSGATELSTLQSSLEPIGGVISWFTGRDDLATFGVNVGKFVSSMKVALSSLDGVTLNQEGLNSVINAAQRLSSLQSSLEPIGGVISWFTGRDDLSTFGTNVGRFIFSMKTALSSLDGVVFNQESLSSIITAATELSKLQSSLEPIGGVISWFTGRDDLATFGVNIGRFIYSMKTALSNLEGFTVNEESLSVIITTSTKLASLQASLESVGGVIDWFTGRDDLGTFGINAGQFITSMKTAFSNLGDTVINEEAMNSIINAATSLATLQSSLSSVGGVIDWFTGRDDLGTFGVNIGLFADAMGKLKTGMGEDGISDTVVASITNAGNALLALNKALPEEGFFDSKITMSEFSDYISDFSSAMSDFSSTASEINPEGINIAINAANRIKHLISSIADLNTSGVAEFTGVGTGGFGADGAAYKIAQAISAFSKKVAGIDTKAVSVSVSAAGKLRRLISSLVGLDYSGIDSFKPEGIGKAIKSYYNKVSGIEPSIISSSVTAAIRLKNLINSMSSLDSSGISKFKVASIGSAIKTYSDSVSGINIGAVYGSINSATRLRNFINSLAGMDSSGASKFQTAVTTLSKTNVTGMVNAFKGSTGKLTNVGSNLMDALTKGMKSRSNAVRMTVTTIITSTINSIRSKASMFMAVGVSLGMQLATGIRNQANNATNAVNSILSMASSSGRGYYWNFYSLGSYVASGLASGIRANIWSAASAAAEMAAAAVAAARANLQINSPSKVFKKIGSGIPEGFALGIGMLGGLVKQSVTNMSDSAIDNARKAISKVYDIMNGDMETQPSIRPVLDLTDVQEGVGAVNGMFGKNFVFGASADVGKISNMMNRRNQNGTNEEVVSAINGLRKDLANVGNTSYNINGITYDDGSNISNAVETLVRAARVERRM